MNRLPFNATLVEHYPGCAAPGWTALTDRPLFDQHPKSLTLLCWTCGARVSFDALTPAANDPGGYDYESARAIPTQHQPGLWVGTGNTRELPAGHDPDRVAGHLVYVEAWLWGRVADAYEWLVATRDGDVIGIVSTYHTQRMAQRYRWGTYADAAGNGDGFKTRDAAVRALIRAVAPDA